MDNNLRGDYKLIECSINGTQLKEEFVKGTIQHSINDNYFQGVLVLSDNLGNIEKLKVKSFDKVKLKYQSEDNKLFEWSGKVIYSSIEIKKGNHQYTIHFVDDLYFKLIDNYSLSAKDKISNIFQKVYGYLGGSGPLEVDETLWIFTYVFSNWSGNKIVDFLEKRAKSTKNGTLFKFFRGVDKYYFKSVEDLLKNGPESTLKYSLVDVNRQNITGKDHIYRDLKIDVFSNASNYNLGQEGSKLYVIDLLNKKLVTSAVKNDKVKILKYRHDDKLPGYVSHFTETISQRLLKAGELNNNVISLTLPGSSIIDLGKIYKVKIPTIIKDSKQVNSLTLSGDFICTEITHDLSNIYECSLKLQRIKKD